MMGRTKPLLQGGKEEDLELTGTWLAGGQLSEGGESKGVWDCCHIQ